MVVGAGKTSRTSAYGCRKRRLPDKLTWSAAAVVLRSDVRSHSVQVAVGSRCLSSHLFRVVFC